MKRLAILVAALALIACNDIEGKNVYYMHDPTTNICYAHNPGMFGMVVVPCTKEVLEVASKVHAQ